MNHYLSGSNHCGKTAEMWLAVMDYVVRPHMVSLFSLKTPCCCCRNPLRS